MQKFTIRAALLALLLSLCIVRPARAQSATANLVDSCAPTYDAATDYFPEKAKVSYAKGFTVEYFKNYKVVTVAAPWKGAKDGAQYVLVQCGTLAPKGYDKAVTVEVPVKRFVSMSTTYLPYLELLGVLDRLVGVDDTSLVYNEKIRAMKITPIGSGKTINIERAIDLKPDLIMTYGSGSAEYDSQPKLSEVGLKVALNADYLETVPLGQTEWMKYIALFFNKEGAAEQNFTKIATDYDALVTKARTLNAIPSVFVGKPYEGTWYVSGGKSYVAALLADAGAAYVFADDTGSGTLPLAFEKVFDKAANAEFWVNLGFETNLKTLADSDPRFADFAAYKSGKVWNYDLRTNKDGSNDYFESGASRPDLVLADLLAIFHPNALPDHQFTYYRQLK